MFVVQEEDKARRKAELTEGYEQKMAAKRAAKEQQETEEEGTYWAVDLQVLLEMGMRYIGC